MEKIQVIKVCVGYGGGIVFRVLPVAGAVVYCMAPLCITT